MLIISGLNKVNANFVYILKRFVFERRSFSSLDSSFMVGLPINPKDAFGFFATILNPINMQVNIILRGASWKFVKIICFDAEFV